MSRRSRLRIEESCAAISGDMKGTPQRLMSRCWAARGLWRDSNQPLFTLPLLLQGHPRCQEGVEWNGAEEDLLPRDSRQVCTSPRAGVRAHEGRGGIHRCEALCVPRKFHLHVVGILYPNHNSSPAPRRAAGHDQRTLKDLRKLPWGGGRIPLHHLDDDDS